MIHEPGPREGVHGPGPQGGWSMDRASMFCKCPEIFAVIRILATLETMGKQQNCPKSNRILRAVVFIF